MELLRSVTQTLSAWHTDPAKKALLLTGARQVGKTFAVRSFARDHYRCIVEINFAETPSARAIFDGDLDASTVIANLTAFAGKPMAPGETLVFLDEIQDCPRARAAIKFLVEDGRFDYIESGSLLGVLYKDVPSLPVGFEQIVRMYPLGLAEFFKALGVQNETVDLVRDCFRERAGVPVAIHERFMRLARLYLAVGGMPSAVARFVETSDLAQVLMLQRDIVELYRMDIAKYAPNKPHVKSIFDAIPAELAQANKRFVLKDLAPSARMERYASDFMWLVDAGVALPCYNVKAPHGSLALNEQRNLFKLYASDLGLLGSMLEQPVQFDLVQGDPGVNRGAILENFAAQELTRNGYHLRYFDKSKYGEVDFVVPRQRGVLPIEIKSGKDYHTHKALDNIMATQEWDIEEALVFCPGNVEVQGRIVYMPWYMLMFMEPEGIGASYVVPWR